MEMAYKMEMICFQNSFETIDKNWEASRKIFSIRFSISFLKYPKEYLSKMLMQFRGSFRPFLT